MGQHVRRLYNKRSKFYSNVMDGMRSVSTGKSLLAALPDSLPDGAIVLDIGCGSGLSCRVLTKRYPRAQVIGLDFAERMLAKHAKRLPAVQLIYGDFSDVSSFRSFPSEKPITIHEMSVDLVVSAGALSEYSNVEQTLPWVFSILKPGGILVNVGVDNTLLGKATAKLWKFHPLGARSFMESCKKTGLTAVTRVRVPRNIFLKHKEEYCVKAIKPDSKGP